MPHNYIIYNKRCTSMITLSNTLLNIHCCNKKHTNTGKYSVDIAFVISDILQCSKTR